MNVLKKIASHDDCLRWDNATRVARAEEIFKMRSRVRSLRGQQVQVLVNNILLMRERLFIKME